MLCVGQKENPSAEIWKNHGGRGRLKNKEIMEVSDKFYHDGKCADKESAILPLPVISEPRGMLAGSGAPSVDQGLW